MGVYVNSKKVLSSYEDKFTLADMTENRMIRL